MLENLDPEKASLASIAIAFASALLFLLNKNASKLIDRVDKLIEKTEETRDAIIEHGYADEMRHGAVMAKLRGDITPIEVPLPTAAEIKKKQGLYGIRGKLSTAKARDGDNKK